MWSYRSMPTSLISSPFSHISHWILPQASLKCLYSFSIGRLHAFSNGNSLHSRQWWGILLGIGCGTGFRLEEGHVFIVCKLQMGLVPFSFPTFHHLPARLKSVHSCPLTVSKFDCWMISRISLHNKISTMWKSLCLLSQNHAIKANIFVVENSIYKLH